MSTAKGREVNIGKTGQSVRKRVCHVSQSKMSFFSSAFISCFSNSVPSFDYSLWSCNLDQVLHDADWTLCNDQHMKNVSFLLQRAEFPSLQLVLFYC